MKNLKKVIDQYGLMAIAMLLFIGCNSTKKEKVYDSSKILVEGTIQAELTSPPFVPASVGNRSAKKLKVNIEVIEKIDTLANGVTYVYWTFGGTVPGSFIRTRVGDEVEFTLSNNPNNKMPHNIDMHAVTGPGGGATSSFVAPGHEKTFSFKTLKPGIYAYHCATAPVGMHIANGMYGLILVEPEGGLPKVDKEYYVMQGDMYTKGNNGEKGLQAFDMNKAIHEDADYVVFNGKVGSLTGVNALTANVGETVRLYVGNGGPNLTSSFHVIGEIFDNVYVQGGTTINHNVQTIVVPPGGAAMVEFKVEVPGTFILVDHAIFRAFNKGALGMLKVSGKENKQIYSGTIQEGIYHPEGGTIQGMPDDRSKKTAVKTNKTLAEKIASGKQIFSKTCFACHQANGEGIPNAFPPLAKSDFLNADVNRAIGFILHGKTGEITVNGLKYNSVMTKQALNDDEIADVLTYVYNSWGNNKSNVTTKMVTAVKNKK